MQSQRKCKYVKQTGDGTLFESCSNTSYNSIFKHRSASGTKHDASIWSISVPDECHTFCVAEVNNWVDKNGNLWSVAEKDSPPYGTRGEILAFFWSPGSNPDPWHGYPVGGGKGLKNRRYPPDDVVEEWGSSGRISFTRQTRILTRRLK